jgi:lysophospholipase L1-like esterase
LGKCPCLKNMLTEGELRYVKKQLLREHFALLLTLVKAAGECHVVTWAPIPRWLHYNCCGDPTHCTNRNSDDFAGNMNLALADIRQLLEDMAALRKLTNVHIFNLLPAQGMTGPDMDIDHALELWGTDPVHPTEEGYAALADSVKQFCNNIIVGARAEASEAASKAAAPK